MYEILHNPGIIRYPPWVRLDLGFAPRGNARRVLALRIPANQRSTGRAGVSSPHRAVSTRETTVFVPGMLEL